MRLVLNRDNRKVVSSLDSLKVLGIELVLDQAIYLFFRVMGF